MSSFAAGKSALYVSAANESPQGTAATLDTAIFVKSCTVNFKEDQKVDDVVTGYLAGISRTRISKSAAGNISFPFSPAAAGWALKRLFGSAPATSALITPSITVYKHTWNAFASPQTFTLMKQSAKISTYTETLAGNGIKSFALKSGKDLVSVDLGIDGLGAGYTLGTSEPVVTPATFSAPTTELPYLVGIKSNIVRVATPIAAGFAMMDWTVNVDPGYGVLDTAGSTDGSMTRFDITGLRKVTAEFTLLEQSRVNLDDFLAETVRTWSFNITGPLLDAPNSLPSYLSLTLNKARMVDIWPSEIGSHGVFMIKMKVEALIDTATGFDMIAELHTLDATY